MSDVGVVLKRFDTPEETRVFEKGRLEIVRIGGMTLARATYEPGWKWSQHVGPGVGDGALRGRAPGRGPLGHGDGRVRGRPRHRADRRLSVLRAGGAARQLGRRQPALRVAASARRGALREVSPGVPPTRAVILAGGRGTRMQKPDAAAALSPAQAAAADEGSKGMMPIHGRPFLDYVLSSLAEAGIEEVCLVTPPGRRRDSRALRPAGAAARLDRLRGTGVAPGKRRRAPGGRTFRRKPRLRGSQFRQPVSGLGDPRASRPRRIRARGLRARAAARDEQFHPGARRRRSRRFEVSPRAGSRRSWKSRKARRPEAGGRRQGSRCCSA